MSSSHGPLRHPLYRYHEGLIGVELVFTPAFSMAPVRHTEISAGGQLIITTGKDNVHWTIGFDRLDPFRFPLNYGEISANILPQLLQAKERYWAPGRPGMTTALAAVTSVNLARYVLQAF